MDKAVNSGQVNLEFLTSDKRSITNELIHTFIRAFESSPVHCLNRRPCLNLRSSGNAGVAASLKKAARSAKMKHKIRVEAPSVDLIHNLVSLCFFVCYLEPSPHPVDQMILKRPLDGLMKQIGGDQLMNVCPRKVTREGYDIRVDTELVPQCC